MLTLAIVALIAAAAAILGVLSIMHGASVARRAAQLQVQEETQDKIRKAQTLDMRFAQEIIEGADMDAAITDLTKGLSSIHAVESEKPHLWDVDDLAKAAKARLRSCS